MVVGPALVGLAAPAGVGTATHGPLGPGVGGTLLLLALLALFCLQYVVVRQVTAKRKDPSLPIWAGIYGSIGIAAGGVLVLVGGYTELLWIGGIASLYFGLHLFQVGKPGRREHRALGFELLTVAVLCLGAPAGAVVAGAGLGSGSGGLGAVGASGGIPGAFTGTAAWAYALSFVFFAGSVFHVRAIVRRLQIKSVPPEEVARVSLARESVVWHGMLALALLASWFVAVAAVGTGPIRAALLTVAFLPAILRAFRTAANLRTSRWNLKTIGFVELGCTIAFVVASAILLGRGLLG